jgi:RNA polymerase sigma-70 factor (family 1)
MFKNSRTSDLIKTESFQLIKLDDKASLEQIYRQYWSKLYIYAFNVLHEREICEDIVQEIFINLWTRRKDVQISDLNSYLYKSVKHQIFNHFRKSKYKKQLLMKFNLINDQYEIDELYEKEELKVHINEVISKLPEQRRIIFQMSRYEGLSNKEITENLNISLQTVKNQISKSLKIIRKSLKNFHILFF